MFDKAYEGDAIKEANSFMYDELNKTVEGDMVKEMAKNTIQSVLDTCIKEGNFESLLENQEHNMGVDDVKKIMEYAESELLPKISELLKGI